MAATSALAGVLSEQELQALPLPVKGKLEECLQTKKITLDDLAERYEELMVDSEGKYFKLEKDLITVNGKLESETKSNEDHKQQLAEIEKKYDETSKELREIKANYDTTVADTKHEKRVVENLEAEKEDLSKLLNKKTQEIDKLNDEWKSMSEKLAEANKVKCEALAKLDEFQTQSVTDKYREKRLAQEKQHLEQQNQWLNSELHTKTEELLKIKREQSCRVLDLQNELDIKSEENSRLEKLTESLKEANQEQMTRIEGYIQKLKDMRDNQTQVEEQFRNEIAAQTKLITLYKTSALEAEAKSAELTKAVEEFQNLLKQATDAHTVLEDKMKEDASTYQEHIKDREERIEKLARELKDANELLEAARKKGTVPLSDEGVEEMFPTAAAASRLLKSGMTLTQIYTEYVQASEQLQEEKADNERLNQQMYEVMKEIEAKAPQLIKQREDYENALETLDNMTRQWDTAMLEHEKMRVEADENSRKANHLVRENKRLSQQTVDLGRQVCILLKELEEARGTVVTTSEDPDVSSSEVSSSSSQLISAKLVTFRSIEELQAQNQKVLGVVRELSEKKEEEETQATNAKTVELQDQLEKSLREMEDMKAARQRQAEMVESIVRQRDMYRVLLAQAGSAPLPIPPTQPSTPFPASKPPVPLSASTPAPPPRMAALSNKDADEAKAALKELQAEFLLYKKEKAENERILNEQMDKLREDTSNFRVQNTKLSSQLEFSEERFKVLQGNIESYKKELNALREKNQKHSSQGLLHEQTINTLRQDLMATQEKLSHAMVQSQNLREERDLLKGVEQRLLLEKESMLREHRSQNLLMNNLQAIQNNLERADYENKTKLGNQIAYLEKECASLRRKLELAADDQKATAQNLQKLVDEAKSQLDKERGKYQKNQDELIQAYSNVHELKQELSQTKALLSAAENRFTQRAQRESVQLSSRPTPGPAPVAAAAVPAPATAAMTVPNDDELTELRSQLAMAQAEVKRGQAQLAEAKKHVAQYKSVASSIEQNLKEQNQTSKTFKEAMEAQVEEAKNECAHIKKSLQSMEKERQDLLNENIRVHEESHNLNAELRKQLASLQHEFQELQLRSEAAIANEQAAREDSQTQAKAASEAHDNYQRELILHAADVEALNVLRQQLDGFNAKLLPAQEEAKKAKDALAQSKASWAEQEKILSENANRAQSSCSELHEQNRLLHDEMQKMSEQMVSLQVRGPQLQHSLDTSFEEQTKSNEQLVEVIKFLRKEKEIAEARVDVIQAESTRSRQRVEHLEKQLADSTKSLNEERDKAQVSWQTAAQHSELMRKVGNLNVLTESNQLLREEKEGSLRQLKELEVKAKKLEEDILPLQEANRAVAGAKTNLEAEKAALRKEVERWKQRCNHLIEQCNKTDPEEHRKLMQEREESRKQLSAANEEAHKHKADASRLTASISTLQNELQSGRQQIEKLVGELNKVKGEADAKTKDSEEKAKTIAQLRKIGRKYRVQAEEKQTEVDKLKSQMGEQQKADSSATEVQSQALASLKQKVEAAEKEKGASQEKLDAVIKEKSVAEQKLEEMLKEKNAATQKAEEADKKAKELQEQNTKTQEELKKLQESEKKLKEEFADLEKKQTQSRNILQTARLKLTSQKEAIEKAKKESMEMKEKLSNAERATEESLNAQKSQYEGRITKLEKDLQESQAAGQSSQQLQQVQEELEKLKKDNAELINKIHQLQKQLESQQKTQQAARPAPSAVPGERTSAGSTDNPPTANIRPMATPPTQGRQAAPIQPVVSTSSGSKATASIKPMAIAVAPTLSQTPTATVMPTTAVTQEDDASSSPVQISQPSSHATRITHPPVQPVSPAPHIEEIQQQEALAEASQEAPTPVSAEVQPVIPTQALSESSPDTADDLSSQVTSAVEEGAVIGEAQGSSSPVSAEVQPVIAAQQASTSAPTQPVQPAKRSRDDLDRDSQGTGSEGSPMMKRIRPGEGERQGEDEARVQLTSAEEDNQDSPVTQTFEQEEEIVAETITFEEFEDAGAGSTLVQAAGGSTAAEGVESQEEEEEVKEEKVEEHAQEQVEEEEEEDDDECVIVVESDDEVEQEEEDEEDYEEEDEDEEAYEDEEEEEEEDMEEYEGEGEYEEGIGEGYHIEMEGEGMEEEHYEDAEEEMQEDQPGTDDDNDVVIVDDEDDDNDNEAHMESTEEGEASGARARPAAAEAQETPQQRTLPPLARLPGRTERLPSIGRAQQLTPFMYTGQSGQFEEGDDSIVPSTPTLFVPRRTDGFAEAVSSPQVPTGRFLFGSGAESLLQQPELAQLASQGALGMDDTRMDLSQFDEGTGRSVPSTPLATTAPVIITPDMQQPGTAAESEAEQTAPGGSTGEDKTEVAQSSEPLGPSSQVPTIEVEEVPDKEEESATEAEGDEGAEEAALLAEDQGEEEAAEPSPATTTGELVESGQGDSQDGQPGEESTSVPPTGEQDTSSAESEQQGDKDSQGGPRPKIKRIVWDAPGDSSDAGMAQSQSPASTSQQQSQAPHQQPASQPQMARRGAPASARGAGQQFQRGRGQPPYRGRGQQQQHGMIGQGRAGLHRGTLRGAQGRSRVLRGARGGIYRQQQF